MDPDRRRGYAWTAPDAADPALRGRTLAVPFEGVWRAALRLAGGGLRGWTVVEADDLQGTIVATTRSLRGAEHDIEIRISLDADGQTRVDASALARKPGLDLGAARRRLRSLFRGLDRAL